MKLFVNTHYQLLKKYLRHEFMISYFSHVMKFMAEYVTSIVPNTSDSGIPQDDFVFCFPACCSQLETVDSLLRTGS